MTEQTPFPYLTMVPGRTPRRKPHETLGQAKKAVLYRLSKADDRLEVPCHVYKWQNNTWELLWMIPADTAREDLPWK